MFFGRSALYQKLATLHGPQDAITSLAFSVYGKFLAATGPGGVNIWNLENLESVLLTSRQGGVEEPDKVAIPACTWLYFAQRSHHVLLLGTWDRSLQLWDYTDETMVPVTHITEGADGSTVQVVSVDVFQREIPVGGQGKIVTSFADRSVCMWTLKAEGELKQKFKVTLEVGFMPKTVRFDAKSGNILVFSMNGGNVVLLDGHTGTTVWRKMNAPKLMGSVALNRECNKFIACTTQAFELLDVEKMSFIRKFDHHPILLSVPKHVSFTEEDSKVVGGTDRGCAEVYDLKNAKAVQCLKYHLGGLVQSVAACTTREHFLIAIAGSNGHQACDVILWFKNRPRSHSSSANSIVISWSFSFALRKKYLKSFVYVVLGTVFLLGYGFVMIYFSEVRSE
ncbi:WD40-repeat-containing domain protein [Lentinula boryana]|uniref:WD40-repeat-containing domain protein n=1 Tax=Lentinula boryana TaxID=40481 RepID=A0ABQ8Q0G2_9AGAR|nr:WD40-repeat-containing domain protein [Lentinula boryana]